MKVFLTVAITMLLAVPSFGQTTPPPSAFQTTTFSFNLSPITLPNLGSSISGFESDAMFPLTTNNRFGMSTLIGQSTLVGGRYDRVFPSVAKYLQNHTALTGGNFEAGVTSTLGVVKASTKNSWGGRAGFYLKYAPAGSTSFNVGIEAQANYLPRYAGDSSPHWVPSVAIGPNFRF